MSISTNYFPYPIIIVIVDIGEVEKRHRTQPRIVKVSTTKLDQR